MTLPDSFGINFTVEDIEATSPLYEGLYPDAQVSEGVFSGISYRALVRDGEVEVCLFQKGEGNPLADSFATIKVDSVPDYEKRIEQMGGNVIIPSVPCPCTGAPFAICTDTAGNQFMIKQPRA